MTFSRSTRRKIKILIVFVLVGGIISVVYSLSVGGQPRIAVTIGCLMTGGIIGYELFYVQQPAGAWLRRAPIIASVAISTLVWTVIIGLALQIVPLFFGLDVVYGGEYHATTFRQDMLVSLTLAFILNTVLRIRSLVGGRVLANFLVGRYHHPLREERVFLFLDLANSTQLSEKLGDIRVQSLIGRFFFDIAHPIAEHGGETHRYIGDEIVVTWPLSTAKKDTRCVQCVFDIQTLIATKSSLYQTDFGVVPQFRAGMHGGPVVAGEVGDDKREIVYFGDTVNTAARIQTLCKEKDSDFLVSGDLITYLKLPDGTDAKNVGKIVLRGKATPINIYALSWDTQKNQKGTSTTPPVKTLPTSPEA